MPCASVVPGPSLFCSEFRLILTRPTLKGSSFVNQVSMSSSAPCQLCASTGHTAKQCEKNPLHKSKKVCQLCDQPGHEAPACPLTKEVRSEADDSGSDEEESEVDDPASKVCPVCEAAVDALCAEDCALSSNRNEKIGLKRTRAAAAAAAAKAPQLKKARVELTSAALTPSEIMALPQSKLAELRVKQIILLPPVWRPWIWAHAVSDRSAAHRQLFDALKAVIRPTDEKMEVGTFSVSDLAHVAMDMDILEGLMDPKPDLSAASHLARIDQAIAAHGTSLIAFKDARQHSWRVVRRALDRYQGEKAQDKAWNAALSWAALEEKKDAKAGGRSRSQSPAGGGGGRRRPNKGGRGKQGKGQATPAADGAHH